MDNLWRRMCIHLLGATCLLIIGVGCRNCNPLKSPGSAEKQRIEATVFDPFADNDIGPEIVGARPKDYQKPHSEAERSRLFRQYWNSY